MRVSRKAVISFLGIGALMAWSLGATYAAFSDKGKFLGSTFNVGSADLKILSDVSLGADAGNLVDEKAGPSFNNISPEWSQQYGIKLYNNATTPLDLVSNANYETANDPEELRQYIYCEIFEWSDADVDGIIDEGEIGESKGMKTLIKWKTEGLPLGEIALGEIKGYVLRFSTTTTFPVSKQGTSGMFDFEFNAMGRN